MTDDQSPDPLEPIPVTEPTATTPGPQTDPAAATAGPPTVEAPVAEPATATDGTLPPAAPPPASPRRSVTVPFWALASVGGVLLLVLGFLLGWVLAPGDGDSDDVANPAANSQQLPDGFEFSPFSPDGNGRSGGDSWEGDGGQSNGDGNEWRRARPRTSGSQCRTRPIPTARRSCGSATSSPADDAGLESGDVITAVDDDEVDDAAALTERIQSLDPGDEVDDRVRARRRGGLHRDPPRRASVDPGDRSPDRAAATS